MINSKSLRRRRSAFESTSSYCREQMSLSNVSPSTRVTLSTISFFYFTFISRTTAFVPVNTVTTPYTAALDTSVLFFRDIVHENAAFELPLNPEFSKSSAKHIDSEYFLHLNRKMNDSKDKVMPIWLRQTKGHFAEHKLASMKRIMIRSGLSLKEVGVVEEAIIRAADGDKNKIAGASDFLLILAETMEMGVTALVAAAFHFCSCVTARETGSSEDASSTISFWDQYIQSHHNDVKYFGDHVLQVVLDAAGLKRIEMVTMSLVQKKPRSKGTPRLALTDLSNMHSLLLSETKDWRALAIRIAACLFRMRGLLEAKMKGQYDTLSSQEIYVAREAIHVFAPLASRLGMHRLKSELEGAAFRILYRRQYGTVSALSHKHLQVSVPRSYGVIAQSEGKVRSVIAGSEMKRILRCVTDKITEVLHNDSSFTEYARSVRVTARVKEPFSLWKKMLKLRIRNISDIPDAIALRVVIEGKKDTLDEDEEVTNARERALCYYVQKICIDHFRPLHDGRFKDYIAYPKQNGYQSLHYTASVESSGIVWPFEVQVRSGKMHQVAEFGLANHWEYKAQSKSNGVRLSKKADNVFKLDRSSASYLRAVQEWHWQQTQAVTTRIVSSSSERTQSLGIAPVHAREERLAPYLDALITAQSDLTREQVFVFMSSHQDGVEASNSELEKCGILALPAGSCILDALRESELALKSAVVRNGCSTEVTEKLRNGDVLSIRLSGESP